MPQYQRRLDVRRRPEARPDVQVPRRRAHDRRLPRPPQRLPRGRPGAPRRRQDTRVGRGGPHARHGLRAADQAGARQVPLGAADVDVHRHVAAGVPGLSQEIHQRPHADPDRLRRHHDEHEHHAEGRDLQLERRQDVGLEADLGTAGGRRQLLGLQQHQEELHEPRLGVEQRQVLGLVDRGDPRRPRPVQARHRAQQVPERRGSRSVRHGRGRERARHQEHHRRGQLRLPKERGGLRPPDRAHRARGGQGRGLHVPLQLGRGEVGVLHLPGHGQGRARRPARAQQARGGRRRLVQLGRRRRRRLV
mmetsp:Transcript_90651/g.252365  ORF Transcript_90651/g.252365 Transcript_90651/m.252365 type:complete len:305 (-) Transcript_90651:388-1302(-)